MSGDTDILCFHCKKGFSSKQDENSIVECILCDHFYHYACTGMPRNWHTYFLNAKNNAWFCPGCESKKQSYQELVKQLVTLESSFNKKLDSQNAEISALKATVQELCKNFESHKKVSSGNKNKRLYAEVTMDGCTGTSTPPKVQKTQSRAGASSQSAPMSGTPLTSKTNKFTKKPREIREIEDNTLLIIKHKDDSKSFESVVNDFTNSIDPLKDPVKDIRKTSKGKLVIRCNDKDSLELMQKKLASQYDQEYNIEAPKTHEPLIKLVGSFDKNLTHTQIKQNLIAQNQIILSFEVESVQHYFNTSCIYLKCNAQLLQFLLNKGKVKLGWSILKVYESVPVTICFKCHKFGHVEKDCKNPKRICPKCCEEHKIKECQSQNFNCPNCSEANTRYSANKNTNHLPWSFSCSIYKKKYEKAQSRINYTK